MTTPLSRQRPGKTIEEVARLVEESSLGTVGARQLRDRAAAGTVARIRARAYFAGSSTGRAWWNANEHSPEDLRCKARELGASGETEISDVLARLASDLLPRSAPGSTDGEPAYRPQPVSAHGGALADWRAFEAFYHREIDLLVRILCERAGLHPDLARELIGQAMVKAFDDWEHLAASGDPGEWVLGCALQLYRSRELPDEDGSWAPSGGTSPASDLAASPHSAAVRCADVRVAGALAVAASQVPETYAASAVTSAVLCARCRAEGRPRSRYYRLTEDDKCTPDEAVARLYREHFRSLVQLAALLVRDIGTAEEVVQDSFVALHMGWRRLRDSDKALSYLRQSVVNRSRSVLRRRVIADRDAPKPQPDMPSAEYGAITLLERSAVVAALRTLPPRQREALVLRYYGDLSEAQIATAMGISRGAVKSHTARAMSALRDALARAT